MKHFSTDTFKHNGETITVETFMNDAMDVTEEFTRKGFKFVVSDEGRTLTMYANGKHPRQMTEATSKDLETYSFNGKTFKVLDGEKCCDTATEQMSLIDVADWMISQF